MNNRGAVNIELTLWAIGAIATAIAYGHSTWLTRDEAMVRASFRDKQIEVMTETVNRRFDETNEKLNDILERVNQ
jgi:hypothetical protein